MTDYLILGLEILAVIFVFAVASLGCLGMWRKFQGYQITVMKDYTNPDRKPMKYYGMVDKADNSIKLYTSSIAFKMARKIPLFNLRPWADSQKRIYGVIGPSGRPGDDMFVPYGTALLSQAAANEYAKLVSDSVTNIMALYEKCKELDLRIGESAMIEVKKGKMVEKLKGTISKINYQGVVFSYFNSPTPKNIVLSIEELDELKSLMTPQQKQVLNPIGYSDFFTQDWVMQKFGIRRVENASIMTVPQKQAIANVINNNNEFVKDGLGFFERHSSVIIGLLILVFSGVAVLFMYYGANSWQQGMTADISAYASTLGLHASTGVGTTGSVGTTTTIQSVNIGGTPLPT